MFIHLCTVSGCFALQQQSQKYSPPILLQKKKKLLTCVVEEEGRDGEIRGKETSWEPARNQ